MMPLVLAPRNDAQMIKRVGGKEETRRHLAELGFVPGSYCTVVNELAGNLIVNIKDSRVAVDKELAMKILV